MSSIVKKHYTIPDDWKIIKIKDVLNEVKYGSSKKLNTEGEGILSLGIPNIIQGEISLKSKRYSEIDDTELARYILNDGEILIVRTNANPDNIGRCALFENIKVPTIFTSYLIKIKINNEKILPKFLTYYLQSNISRRQFLMRARTSAGNYNLSIPEIKSIELILPPLLEQQRVISILLNVDKSIVKSQQLIENLQFLKKGLMRHLFTKGIGHTEFKETRLGKIPKEWEFIEFPRTISNKTYTYGSLKTSEYQNVGKIPIIDQSMNNIAGYSDIEDLAYEGDLPVIIFGDHTRIFKYINFKFICGADGTKILIPNKNLFNPLYLYYFYSNLRIKNLGYSRHYKVLKEQQILKPPLEEQKFISDILGNIDNKIKKENSIRNKIKLIKKGLMQDLLTGKKRVKIS